MHSLLRSRPALPLSALRSYATASSSAANTLVLVEHKDNKIAPATFNAITAAKKLGGKTTGLVIGTEGGADAVLEAAKKSISHL
jgi:electron transfer flavoprotein alpha subunit